MDLNPFFDTFWYRRRVFRFVSGRTNSKSCVFYEQVRLCVQKRVFGPRNQIRQNTSQGSKNYPQMSQNGPRRYTNLKKIKPITL